MSKLLSRCAIEEDTHVADPNPYPDSNGDTCDDTDVKPIADRPPSTPHWVKVSGIIAIVLVLLFVILHLTGKSLGGPGGHTPSIEQGVKQP